MHSRDGCERCASKRSIIAVKSTHAELRVTRCDASSSEQNLLKSPFWRPCQIRSPSSQYLTQLSALCL